MIYLNGSEVKVTKFPNGELKIDLDKSCEHEYVDVEMIYESSDDLVTLAFVKSYLDNVPTEAKLTMRYVPYSRMDRSENDSTLFSLKHFCKFINSLNFTRVFISEPHSNMTTALLDRCTIVESTINMLKNFIIHSNNLLDIIENTAIILPDIGAQKRYSKELPYKDKLVCYTVDKARDFDTGKITAMKINEEISKDIKKFIIIDDLCSRGGTFIGVINAIKENVKSDDIEFTLIVPHCEKTVLEGELINEPLLKHIITTDSIIQETTNPKIKIMEYHKPWTNF